MLPGSFYVKLGLNCMNLLVVFSPFFSFFLLKGIGKHMQNYMVCFLRPRLILNLNQGWQTLILVGWSPVQFGYFPTQTHDSTHQFISRIRWYVKSRSSRTAICHLWSGLIKMFSCDSPLILQLRLKWFQKVLLGQWILQTCGSWMSWNSIRKIGNWGVVLGGVLSHSPFFSHVLWVCCVGGRYFISLCKVYVYGWDDNKSLLDLAWFSLPNVFCCCQSCTRKLGED